MLSAAGAAILAHALLIATALGYGTDHPFATSHAGSGAGSIAIVSDQNPVMTLIFIDEPQPAQEAEPPARDILASRGFARDELIKLLSPDGEPSSDLSLSKSADTAVAAASLGAAQRAILFGRYVKQVDAHIERAWLKPSSPVGARQFTCQVMIKQDRNGNVQETTLQACNGDPRWQMSLVRAIQAASPLPSPPDERVFADAISLTFTAYPRADGTNADEFAPMASQPIATSNFRILKNESRPGTNAAPPTE